MLSSAEDIELIIESNRVEGQTTTNDLILWDIASREILELFDSLPHDISNVTISPDGTRLASTNFDGLSKV